MSSGNELLCAVTRARPNQIAAVLHGAAFISEPDRAIALATACREHRIRALRALLDAGVSPDGYKGLIQPIFDALQARSAEPLLLLTQAGANVNAYQDRASALHYAARNSSGEMCKVLIDAGARLEALNDYRQTPLHVACRYDNFGAAKVLVRRGANINARDAFGFSVLAVAVRSPAAISIGVIYEMLVRGAEIYPRLSAMSLLLVNFTAGCRYALEILGMVNCRASMVAVKQNFTVDRFRFVRQHAATLCIALYTLRLPALVMVHILEHAFLHTEAVRMSCWWDVAVRVKHFHDKKIV